MEIEWSVVATVVAPVLVFLTTGWGLYRDHQPIRKLERLLALRDNLKSGSSSEAAVDEAIDVLAKRVKDSAYPIGKERIAAMFLALTSFLTGSSLLASHLEEDGAGKWFGLGSILLSLLVWWAAMSAPAREKS